MQEVTNQTRPLLPEYDQWDALRMAELVQRGEVSPLELCQTAIQVAEACNPTLNAIVRPLYEQARKAATRPFPEGKFAGVPFLLKDLLAACAGVPLTGGSKALRHYVPPTDSETNTPEFGLLDVTEPELFGPARNPWNLGHTPGGSSGGSAAAVAAGIVPMASGGDGGGSIRIPAACCGLFGLKPSRGRVPTGPYYGEIWQGAVVEHVLTRSVRDSAAMLDAIAGSSPGAPYTIAPPVNTYLEEIKKAPGRLRIGFSVSHPLGRAVHPECIRATHETALKLEALGHFVEEVALPYQGRVVAEAFMMLYFGETGAAVADLAQALRREARASDVEPATWLLSRLGKSYSAADFVRRRQDWNTLARNMGAFHRTCDLLLTPTLAVPPARVGETALSPVEKFLIRIVTGCWLTGLLRRTGVAMQMAEKNLNRVPFTQIANLTGQPAMSVPLYWTPDELPCGTQFIVPFGREDLLFRLAGQLEQAYPWFPKRPPLARPVPLSAPGTVF